ncbi:MAG: DNA-3-methyladenine glycosylase family protein [Solirubrobacteraceae bacterium]
MQPDASVPRGDAYPVQIRLEVRPRWTFRLSRRVGLDRLARLNGGVLHRLLHHEGRPVAIRVAQPAPDRVLFGACASSRSSAEWGIARMRAALGVDQDLGPFYERFRADPLIGAAVRARPGLRVAARPDPFEALVWAVCEQLIEYERAAAIQRRLIARLGRRCPVTGLADAPTATAVAAQSPALLQACGLTETRALALIAAAREVASGRVDLDDPDHERGWRRLARIPGIGPWTLQTLALTGQGRLDQLPAGDLGYLKLVGRLSAPGGAGPAAGPVGPAARATVEEVERLFAPYAPWAGLAGLHALLGAASPLALRLAA